MHQPIFDLIQKRPAANFYPSPLSWLPIRHPTCAAKWDKKFVPNVPCPLQCTFRLFTNESGYKQN